MNNEMTLDYRDYLHAPTFEEDVLRKAGLQQAADVQSVNGAPPPVLMLRSSGTDDPRWLAQAQLHDAVGYTLAAMEDECCVMSELSDTLAFIILPSKAFDPKGRWEGMRTARLSREKMIALAPHEAVAILVQSYRDRESWVPSVTDNADGLFGPAAPRTPQSEGE
jgi:hypothetical protein